MSASREPWALGDPPYDGWNLYGRWGSRLITTALAAAAVSQLVFIGHTVAGGFAFPLSYFGAHFVWLAILQLGSAAVLAPFLQWRAWAAGSFALPVLLAGAPVARDLAGLEGLAALGALLAVVVGVFVFRGRGHGAPILAAALGAWLGCELTRFRLGAETPAGAEELRLGLIAVAVALLLLASSRLPRAVAVPSHAASLAIVLGSLALGGVGAIASDRDAELVPSDTPGPDGARPVVLIVLDTVRADHLAMYGHHRDTMPRLEEWGAAHAVRVDEAVSNGAWTLPTHASLFTGLHPPRHGAHAARLADEGSARSDSVRLPFPLNEHVPTLAEIFSAQGYAAIGISANYGYLSERFGLSRGFGSYDAEPDPVSLLRARSPWRVPTLAFSPFGSVAATLDTVPPFSFAEFFLGVKYRRASAITDLAIEALDQVGSRPFFLFVNYMDAHDPYYPPSRYRYTFEGVRDDLGQHGFDWSVLRGVVKREASLREGEAAHLRALYDAELRYLDDQLARLLEALERRDDWGEMLVVVTSDHGEAFGEHGDLVHGINLHAENVRVPLLIKPGAGAGHRPGTVLEGPVETVDLFATALQHAGLLVPDGVDGRPWGSGRESPRSWLFRMQPSGVMAPRFDRELRALRRDGFKLIQSTPGETRLFHVALDPEELRDVSSEWPEEREALESRLGPRKVEDAPRDGSEASPELLERLRGLGYVQ